jgi:hypothetical protein
MADRLDAGSAWLDGVMDEHATRTVSYGRAGATVEVHAQVGSSEFPVESGGVEVAVQTRDYIIAAKDLVLGAVAITPERGDRIQDDSGPGGEFEVSSPAGGHPWRWSDDAYQRIYRIHTVRVGEGT